MKTSKIGAYLSLVGALALGSLVALWIVPPGTAPLARAAVSEGAKPKMLAHNVYFSLNDPTPENIQKLVDACHKYLSGHPGVVYYGAGTLSDLDRPVNDRGFDVGLHVIFEDRAAHDKYQTAPRHLQFIEENKSLWKQVRVFDSDVTSGE